MNAQENDIHDLLSNPSFRAWVFEGTPELDAYWESWQLEYPDKKEILKKARILAKALRFDEKPFSDKDKQKLWRKIEATNHLRNKGVRDPKVSPLTTQNSQGPAPEKLANPLLRYAAVLAGLVVLAVAATLVLKGINNETEIAFVEKANEPGQKSTIFLADGTMVQLNASSALRYPQRFTGEERKVFLKGEAFFKVKQGVRPFVVETENLNARVLGTSFNIRDFNEREGYSLSLLTGKVMVACVDTPQEYIILNPGEKTIADSTTGSLLTTAFDYDEEMAWKDGALVFKSLPFLKVLERLEAWYGVEFLLENQPADELLITGKFQNEYLDNVLRSIAYTGGFTYKFSGKTIYINFDKKP